MKTPGYMITCNGKHCQASDFFQDGENWLDADWYPHPEYPDTMHLCTDCHNAMENERDEQAKSPQHQNTEAWRREVRCSYAEVAQKRLAEHEDSIPYASAIRENLFIKE